MCYVRKLELKIVGGQQIHKNCGFSVNIKFHEKQSSPISKTSPPSCFMRLSRNEKIERYQQSRPTGTIMRSWYVLEGTAPRWTNERRNGLPGRSDKWTPIDTDHKLIWKAKSAKRIKASSFLFPFRSFIKLGWIYARAVFVLYSKSFLCLLDFF